MLEARDQCAPNVMRHSSEVSYRPQAIWTVDHSDRSVVNLDKEVSGLA